MGGSRVEVGEGAYSRLGAYSNKYGSLPVSARGVKHP